MNLHVKFELNKALDKRIALKFINAGVFAGSDDSTRVVRPHPELAEAKGKDETEAKKIIDIYLDKYYEKNFEELKTALNGFEEKWSVAETRFISQLNNIFKNQTPPEGKYIGYLSIIDGGVRDLGDKTFQVFYKHGMGSNFCAMHEVLHFFFYDYAVKKYPEIFGGLNMNNGIFWRLAEVFNDMIMSLPEFVELHGVTKMGVYPDHKKYIEPMKKIWNDNPDIDKWILGAYEYLKSEK
jgi:hypothetical protein